MNDPSSTPPASTRTFTIFVGGPLTMADLREGSVLETEPNVSILGGNGRTGLTTVSGSAVMSGALPAGHHAWRTLGVFTGTPTRHGTYNFTLELNDCQTSSCSAGTTPQTVTKNIAWRVSAKDQQGNSQGSGAVVLSFGGASGRKLAQVFTVGAQGTLNAIGFGAITCPVTQTTVRIDVLVPIASVSNWRQHHCRGSARSPSVRSLTPQVPGRSARGLPSWPASMAVVGHHLNAASFDSYNGATRIRRRPGNDTLITLPTPSTTSRRSGRRSRRRWT